MDRMIVLGGQFFLMLCLAIADRKTEARLFKLGLLAPFQTEYDFSAQTSAGAVSLAIDTINNDPELNVDGLIELSVVARDTECTSKQALGNAVDLWYNETVDAFLGPPCSEACRAVAEVAAMMNIPIISWIATAPDLADRVQYTTLSRTLGPFSKMGNFLVEVMAQYDWRRVVVISSNYLQYKDATAAITEVFINNNITIAYQMNYDGTITDETMRRTLREAKLVGRIVYFITSKKERRRFMLTALDLGMCEGEFVFFTIDMLPDENVLSSEPFWKAGDQRDADARRAFEAVFHVTLAALESGEVRLFLEEVARRNREPPWNFSQPLDQGNKYSPFLYDAVLLYAVALGDTIRAGGNITNTTEIVHSMRGRVIQGYSGNMVLDGNGDREPDYWITDMDPETGHFVKIAEIRNHGIGIREFRKLLRPPAWPKGLIGIEYAPPDEPRCGFTGEKCEEDTTNFWIFFGTAGAIVMMVGTAFGVGILIYRRKKFEKDLLIQSWRIAYDDIELMHRRGASCTDLSGVGRRSTSILGSGSLLSNGGIGSISQSLSSFNKSLRSVISQGTTQQQIFADVGYYRGAMLAIKRIRKEHIQLTRSVLLEFSEMKDLTHSNLNLFMGACVDPPNICLFWQYCPKGSLSDLLNNDEVKLDEFFKMSFMTDIAKGMEYLHKTHIVSHGNLKSPNCLVDGRWTVRITEYGLPTIVSGQNTDHLSEEEIFRKKLWTAPELLRENVPPMKGTQKGDIYSFAIVAYEIMMRTEPYALENMTPRDVVNRVRNGESIPFRPSLPDTTELGQPMLDLIRTCWSEEPEYRPSFGHIKTKLRRMTGGEINILDNIMKMMEKYANNLEEIVNERTSELAEEKKKTDLLLYKMLPSTVAEQLKAGQVVKPENYDAATIYFSDIVGFTTISADSSPMQIVDFLNDLYTCFDDIIAKHDVYKVETIGDAYMVVSGVPVRNGLRHVAEIANCSLELLSAVTGFKIRHRPHQQLRLRIGIHTGPVVAGVVGLMMPRYCLFGDTVNIAERMESTGKPLRIHVSKTAYLGLKNTTKDYEFTMRGEINVVGKGLQTTYWLHGKKGFDKPLPKFDKDAAFKEDKAESQKT